MDITRRSFLKMSGATALAGGVGVSLQPGAARAQASKWVHTKETTTICPYCAVGCGIIVQTRDGRIVNSEGDPDHPINEGASVPRVIAPQLSENTNRLTKPLYRAPFAKEWKEVSWTGPSTKLLRM